VTEKSQFVPQSVAEGQTVRLSGLLRLAPPRRGQDDTPIGATR